MPGALDVLVELNFQTNEASLSAAAKEAQLGFDKQSNILKEIQGQIDRMGQSQAATSGKTVQGTKAANDEYKRLYDQLKKLENENVSYATTVKKLQTEQAKLSADFQKNFKAQSIEVKKLTSEIDLLKKKLTETATVAQATSGAFSKIKEGFMQGIGIGAGFGVAGLVAGGINSVRQVLSDASDLASEAEGVRKAFDRLNEPRLLANLRDATKGTVSDLELMKQAVMFNNFGLPIKQLADGLEFARIRAKETGQSVEYLVNSITVGIGRQSPLILDNLGINARRVREEFKKTGDFAQAAFQIIREETAKSGADLETYAERIAKINATLENTKTRFGEAFNFTKGALLELGADFGDLFSGDLAQFGQTNLQKYLDALEAAVQAEKKLAGEQATINQVFATEFQRYADSYKNADLTMRKTIEGQAKTQYETILNGARSYYGKDLASFENYSRGLQSAYKRLTGFFSGSSLNIKTLGASQLPGLTREELTGVQDQIGTARNALTSKDTAEIGRLNKLSAAVTAELNKINGVVDKSLIKAAEKTAERIAEIRERIRQLYKEGSFIDPEKEIGAIEADLKKVSDAYKALAKELFGSLKDALSAEAIASGDIQTGGALPFGTTSEQLNAQLEITADVNKKKKVEDDARKEREEEGKKELKREIENLAVTLADSVNMFLDAEIQKTSILIAEQEKRVANAKEAAKNGNTALLAEEQARLDELEKKRRAYAESQREINAILIASQSAVNVVQAVTAVLTAAPGDPYSLPVRVLAAVAAVVGGIASVTAALQDTSGFKKGGYTGDGNADDEAGVVHKGEYVMPKGVVSRIGLKTLEDIHYGRIPAEALSQHMSVNYGGLLKTNNDARKGNNYDFRKLEGKFDLLLEAFNKNGGTSLTIDENGIAAIYDKHVKNKMILNKLR